MHPSAVPDFNQAGVLPSFVGNTATASAARSPFKVTIYEAVNRFAYTKERARLLLGLNEYRRKLFLAGFVVGQQWVDGSFVEDVERTRGRAPNDIDVVTLFRRPIQYLGNQAKWQTDFRASIFNDLFESRRNKHEFSCDTYPIDMDSDPETLVANSNYWFGLFSEQRDTSNKKGILSISLSQDVNEFSIVAAAIRAKQDV